VFQCWKRKRHEISEGFIQNVQKTMKQKGEEMTLPREKTTRTAITLRSQLKKNQTTNYAQHVFII